MGGAQNWAAALLMSAFESNGPGRISLSCSQAEIGTCLAFWAAIRHPYLPRNNTNETDAICILIRAGWRKGFCFSARQSKAKLWALRPNGCFATLQSVFEPCYLIIAIVFVSDFPDGDPIISLERRTYPVGEILKANCTSYRNHPSVNITWSINGLPVSVVFIYILRWQRTNSSITTRAGLLFLPLACHKELLGRDKNLEILIDSWLPTNGWEQNTVLTHLEKIKLFDSILQSNYVVRKLNIDVKALHRLKKGY